MHYDSRMRIGEYIPGEICMNLTRSIGARAVNGFLNGLNGFGGAGADRELYW